LNTSETKTLRHVRERYGPAVDELDDVGLAGFIVQNWFTKEPVSVASIGAPSEPEFLGLNSLVDRSASVVVLGVDRSPGNHERIGELSGLAEREGFEVRTQSADLTLPGRWPQLLPALAARSVGILGVDAAWAASELKFWDNLRSFARPSGALVYIRGALDFRHADLTVRLLRGIPAAADIQLIASTRRSLWFASGDGAPGLRAVIRASGIFQPPSIAGAEPPAPDAPVVVEESWEADSLDVEGRFPLLFVRGGRPGAGARFGPGWSSGEPDGRWTEGAEATFTITPGGEPPGAARLAVSGNGWIPPGDGPQVVQVGLGPRPKRWTELSFANPSEIKAAVFDLAGSDFVDGALDIRVKVRKPGRPSDHGEPDSRTLGFKLRTIGLFTKRD